ncbi:MAG: roadblock/LC7 domain-containing protein [Myxococcota bacterium]
MRNATDRGIAPLSQLRQLNPEVEAVVILSPDGALESVDADAEIIDALGPILTTLLTMADRASKELGRGALDQFIVRGGRGLVVAQDLFGGRLLAVIARRGGRLGLLLDDVSACAAQLEHVAA